MMAHVRPRLRSSPLYSLCAVLALASLVGTASPAAAAPEPPTRRERIEEIWLDARGESGRVRTVPLYLDDAPAEYRFGPAYCGRGHRLGEGTLQAMQGALATGQPVRIDAGALGGDEDRRCITGVAFFAP
jgi:hypothetical protein